MQLPSGLQHVLHTIPLLPIPAACRHRKGASGCRHLDAAIWQLICFCSLQTQQGCGMTTWGYAVHLSACCLPASQRGGPSELWEAGTTAAPSHSRDSLLQQGTYAPAEYYNCCLADKHW